MAPARLAVKEEMASAAIRDSWCGNGRLLYYCCFLFFEVVPVRRRGSLFARIGARRAVAGVAQFVARVGWVWRWLVRRLFGGSGVASLPIASDGQVFFFGQVFRLFSPARR